MTKTETIRLFYSIFPFGKNGNLQFQNIEVVALFNNLQKTFLQFIIVLQSTNVGQVISITTAADYDDASILPNNQTKNKQLQTHGPKYCGFVYLAWIGPHAVIQEHLKKKFETQTLTHTRYIAIIIFYK